MKLFNSPVVDLGMKSHPSVQQTIDSEMRIQLRVPSLMLMGTQAAERSLSVILVFRTGSRTGKDATDTNFHAEIDNVEAGKLSPCEEAETGLGV